CFQAEDGIRDDLVTGVQTCALPISLSEAEKNRVTKEDFDALTSADKVLYLKLIEKRARSLSIEERQLFEQHKNKLTQNAYDSLRSEERRVGKECKNQ